MMPLSSIPGNYNQGGLAALQQILMQRKQQGMGQAPVDSSAMPSPLSPMQQSPNSEAPIGDPGVSMRHIQDISSLMGYHPSTLFGYDVGSVADQKAPTSSDPQVANAINQIPGSTSGNTYNNIIANLFKSLF